MNRLARIIAIGSANADTTPDPAHAIDAAIEAAVFDVTPTLRRVRQAARARMLSPWAVLASVLVRVAAELPPHIVLPPIVGARGSLNMAVALVGPPGLGKSAAHDCAGDLLDTGSTAAENIGPGTGEGIAQSFLRTDKSTGEQVLVDVPHRLLYADEVEQIGAVQARNGATFAPMLRTMLTGGHVTNTNAERGRRRLLKAHTYRLGVVAGLQPELSGVLLNRDQRAAGTPQRFTYWPAGDPLIPDTEPPWPGMITWTSPYRPLHPGERFLQVEVVDEAQNTIRENRRLVMRSNGAEGLDGHLLRTRLQVAAVLAALHGDVEVTDEWWALAGQVMLRSNAERELCQRALTALAEQTDIARGRGDYRRRDAAEASADEHHRRMATLLWRTVVNGYEPSKHDPAKAGHANAKHAPGEGCTARCLAFALRNHGGRGEVDQPLRIAVDLDWIDERDGRYHPGDSRPAGE